MTKLLDYATTSVPMTLLPVSLQIRFTKKELLVRVLPDAVHASKFSEQLTEFEALSGNGFWQVLWKEKGGTKSDISAARKWLAKRVGAYRARYVADLTRPLNWGRFSEKTPSPPKLTTVETPPINAGLLPDFWVYQLRPRTGGLIRGRAPNPIVHPLAMAPNFGAGQSQSAVEDDLIRFFQNQNLDWMINFEKAESVGMAFRIELPQLQQPPYESLFVTGLSSAGPEKDATSLASHLHGQVFQEGFDILPQGVPTNNSDAGRAAFGEHTQNIDAIFDTQRNNSEAPRNARTLYDMVASDALGTAFGLGTEHSLGHAVNADLTEAREARQMNALLGPGIANYFTDEIFTEVGGAQPLRQNDQVYSRVERHFIDWVFGPGALPSVRVGAQPYGVLPVMLESEARANLDNDVHATLNLFGNEWFSVRPVPTLDPQATNGTDARDTQTSVAALAQVLGAVPHPTNLHVRILSDMFEEDFERLKSLYGEMFGLLYHMWARPPQVVARWPPAHFEDYDTLFGAMTDARRRLLYEAERINDQQGIIQDLRQSIMDTTTSVPQDIRQDLLNHLGPIEDLLQFYREASDGLPEMFARFIESGPLRNDLPQTGVDGLSRAVTSIFESELYPVGTLIGSLKDMRKFLSLLKVKNGKLLEKEQRKPVTRGQAPLLHHLIQQSYLYVDDNSASLFGEAFVNFKVMIDKMDKIRWAAMVEKLDLRLRETLGLFMHRFDAWKGSFANKALAEKRISRPEGTVIGAYGWLFDLQPNNAPVSDGFIHAQSMNHAKTAALLRSAWRGFETSAETAPLAVDLSSNRIRTAHWILDGVRAGTDLEQVLGARLERRMRDHKPRLDRFVDEMRTLTAIHELENRTKSAITNGWRVARAFGRNPAPEDAALKAQLENTFSALGNSGAAVIKQCKAIADEMDSVADLLLAQSIHSLAQGNAEEAAAVLNFGGDSQGAVPPISVTQTVPQGRAISHRVVAILPNVNAVFGKSALHAVNPALSQWLEDRIGSIENYELLFRIKKEGESTFTGYLQLRDLELTPLELVMLVGRDAEQSNSLLARMMRAKITAQHSSHLGTESILVLETGQARRGLRTLDDFGLIAAAARDVLDGNRALAAIDLAPPGSDKDLSTQVDATDLTDRANHVKQHLQTLRDAVASKNISVKYIFQLVALRVSGAIDLLEKKSPKRENIFKDLDSRIAVLDNKSINSLEALGKVIAKQMVVVPRIIPGDVDKRHYSAQVLKFHAQNEGDAWARKVANVSPNISAFNAFKDLTFATAANDEIATIQVPHLEDAWLATTAPGGAEGSRGVVTALTGGESIDTRVLSGLLLDSWTENVPSEDYQTGVAFHHDSPSARAPQCILLAMFNSGNNVDEQIFQLMSEVSSDMVSRCFGPDRYTQAGHVLPMTYLGKTYSPMGSKK